MFDKPVYVTQPSLPSFEDYASSLKNIWESKVLTNNGEYHQELEGKLAKKLMVGNLSLFNNGTSALLAALKVFDLEGEVITTPYTFVATTHAILWNGLTPVFVDIDPSNFAIDANKIEAAITPRTTAIVAVHCYGFPCDVDALATIAKKHNLKLIFDAAHAFNVQLDGSSVLNYGDISILSFHATKVFNTFEGGATVSSNKEMKSKVDKLKNFGIVNEVEVESLGINGKMSEVNAALGLLQINRIEDENEKRKVIYNYYLSELSSVSGIKTFPISSNVEANYGYFPVLIDPSFKVSRDELYEQLKSYNIFSRRYFYPLISNLPMYKGMDSAKPGNLPVANSLAEQILCLPIFSDLSLESAEKIVRAIKKIAGV